MQFRRSAKRNIELHELTKTGRMKGSRPLQGQASVESGRVFNVPLMHSVDNLISRNLALRLLPCPLCEIYCRITTPPCVGLSNLRDRLRSVIAGIASIFSPFLRGKVQVGG